MRNLIASAWLLAVCAVAAFGEGLSEHVSPETKADFGRVYRQGQDLESRTKINQLHNHPIQYNGQAKPVRKRTQKPANWQNGQIVYGKHPGFAEQQHNRQPSLAAGAAKKRVHVNNQQKFKPSPADPFLPSESVSSHHQIPPTQKHLQKYATQLHAAQKNSAQLSDYQKYILNQDPLVKKFVFAQIQSQTSRTPKYVTYADMKELSTPAPTARKTVSSEPVRSTTASTQEVVSHEMSTATTSSTKERKVPKLESDNTAQSTAYKYTFEPELVQQYVPTYVTQEKTALANLGDHAAIQFTLEPVATVDEGIAKLPYPSPTPIPVSVLGIDDKFTEDHLGEEHPTKEPKYEFKYQVQDHEKHTHFGHSEARKGKTTWGKYYVQLSDGRFETVKYWADKTGYHAEVDFKGEAKHPPPQPAKPKEVAISPAAFVADDLKLYGIQDTTSHKLYSVDEPTSSEYH